MRAMDMLEQTLIHLAEQAAIGVLVIGLAAVGWVCRTLYTKLETLTKDIALLHLKIAEDYVPQPRFEAVAVNLARQMEKLEGTVERALGRMENRLDGKQDRAR